MISINNTYDILKIKYKFNNMIKTSMPHYINTRNIRLLGPFSYIKSINYNNINISFVKNYNQNNCTLLVQMGNMWYGFKIENEKLQ